jgi:xylan 1,4-beta-xylosidase
VFRMYARMGGNRVPAVSSGAVPLDAILADGVRGSADVAALASLDGNRLTVMAWHYHDDDVEGPDAAVILELAGLARRQGRLRVTHYRIDDAHSNAYAEWMRMGSPIAPDRTQYAQLETAGKLAALPASEPIPVAGGGATLQLRLPRQAVSLLVFEWES